MKINALRWHNYRGISDGEIVADSHDVIITGRNGSGKSTIASILPFVLFGTDANKAKCYADGLLPTDDGLVHAAEVEFDDGLTLRREYFWNGKSNTQKLYIDGQAAKQDEFRKQINQITKDGGEILFNPFAFCELKRDEQRNLLLKIFGETKEATIIDMPQFADVKKILNGFSADKFIDSTKKEIDYLQDEFDAITPAIDELELQLKDTPQDDETELSKRRDSLQYERAGLIPRQISAAEKTLQAEIEKLREEKISIQAKQAVNWSEQLDTFQKQANRLAKMRTDALSAYWEVHDSTPGICPTCGQKFPLDKFNAVREKKLTNISAHGKQIAAELADINTQITELKAKITTQTTEDETRTERLNKIELQIQALSDKITEMQNADKIERRKKCDELDNQINDLNTKIIKITQSQKIRQRIEQLHTDKETLSKKIIGLEHQLARIKNFRHEKITLIEKQINANFQRVNFKLFDVLITTGEVKPTCEPMLDGVPYGSLSKGERFLAALDIFKTLQEFYRVELPLFIDDAEAYTANSFVGLPNQKFYFRVNESDLTINISSTVEATS